MVKMCTIFSDKLHDSPAHYQYFREKGTEQAYNKS